MPEPTLEFIAQKLDDILAEQRLTREQIGILANAIIRLEQRVDRLENRIDDLVDEVRLIRMALADHDLRLRKLERVPS